MIWAWIISKDGRWLGFRHRLVSSTRLLLTPQKTSGAVREQILRVIRAISRNKAVASTAGQIEEVLIHSA